jgi:hypothetical protein
VAPRVPTARFLRDRKRLVELISKASGKSAKANRIHSGGIKPLNAPRVIYVRTDSMGNPTSVQVPPTINSQRARRQSNNPHPNPLSPRERGQDQHTATTSSPSQAGRELEGGSERGSERAFRSSTRSNQSVSANLSENTPLVSDGKWMQVVEIENLWKVNDEWWRGPEEEIARLYYGLRLQNGQQLTVYFDLIVNSWYRQSG